MDPNSTQPEDCENGGEGASPSLIFYRVVCGGLGLSICVLGLLGNGASLLILKRLKKKSVSILLLRSLAVADCACLLGYVFNNSVTSLMDYKTLWSCFQYFYKYVVFPVFATSLTVSAWLTCLLTIHR